MTMRSLILTLLFGVVLIVAGCSSERGGEGAASATHDSGKLVIEAPWVRPGAEGGMSALYFRVENGTTTEDTLRAVRTNVADTVEIHESYATQQGGSSMRRFGPVRIPANNQVAFAPGGLHVMLIQLTQPLPADSSITVELQFAQAGTRSVTAPIRVQPPAPSQ